MTAEQQQPKEHCGIEEVCRYYGQTIDGPFPCKGTGCKGKQPQPHPAQQAPDEMEQRFETKREAWEQGYQDGGSAVQHDLNLICKEAAEQARKEGCPHWKDASNLKSDFRDQIKGNHYCDLSTPEQALREIDELKTINAMLEAEVDRLTGIEEQASREERERIMRLARSETMHDGIHEGWLMYDSFRQEVESPRKGAGK